MRRERAPAIVRYMRRLRPQASSAFLGSSTRALALAALMLLIAAPTSDGRPAKAPARSHQRLSSLPAAARGPIAAALARRSRLRGGALAKLSAPDGGEGDQLGFGVAISGNTIVLGAPGRQVGANVNQGVLYVFTKGASGWASATLSAELVPTGGLANEDLGSTIAISGGTIVAGAEGRGGHEGIIYVFSEPASGWAGKLSQRAELTPADGQPHDRFGTAVAISGSTIVAGADYHQVGASPGQGTLYVFEEPAMGWTNATQTAELTASNGASNSHFGFSVGATGETIVGGGLAQRVGAHARQGAVYVFERPAGGWANARQNAELTATDGRTHDNLGYAVALSGDTVVASAPLHELANNAEEGVVYVFTKPPSGWKNARQTAELSASDGRARDHFGWGVALAGQAIAVGAPRHMVGARKKQGALYLFKIPGSGRTSVTQSAELTARPGEAQARLGWDVAASGNTVVAGAPYTTANQQFAAGAAYVLSGAAAAKGN
jgi:FG-GAP repeat